MSEPTNSNPSTNLFGPDDVEDNVVDDVEPENDGPVDLGNHEADVVNEPPHINEEGHLVDEDGKKVFTTTEEALKDGSFVLDSQGRMPGVYLDDVERFQLEDHRKRVEKEFEKSSEGTNSLVERQVNVKNSPLPPVTVVVKQEHPLDQTPADNDEENVTDPAVNESEDVKV